VQEISGDASQLENDEPDSTDRAAATFQKREMRFVWLLMAAAFVVMLNENIMNVALPELMVDLRIDARTAQWLSTAFMLTMAVVLPTTGFLLDRFNARAIFVSGLAIFCLGTLIGALAPGFGVLLTARIFQAGGSSMVLSLLMTTIMRVAAPSQVGKIMGLMSIVMSVAPSIGPTVSGVVLNALPWQWMFWIVLPIALVMLLAGFGAAGTSATKEPRVPLDIPSTLLSAFGFAGLVFGLSNIGSSGNASDGGREIAPATLVVSFLIGAIGLLLFVWRQVSLQRTNRALLDLRAFKSPVFAIAIVIVAGSMTALFGTIILLPLYLHQSLGLAPIDIGLMLLPGGVALGAVSLLAGWLYDRHNAVVLLVPGAILASATLGSLGFVTEQTPPYLVVIANVVLFSGIALLYTPLVPAALGSIDSRLYAHASAIFGTMEQVAAAAGTALFVSIMASQASGLESHGVAAATAATGGIRFAFFVGALISLPTIVAAFFIRKPSKHTQATSRPHDRAAIHNLIP
jgi:MFS transporter, DHA2 family, lincomycin resistance protein